jgi:hypothetical protein
MLSPFRTVIIALPLVFMAACGDEPDKAPPATRVVEEPTPKDAVAEVKLQEEAYLDYYYCAATYPKTCDDVLKQAYVMPRDPGEAFRIVFFNNQDPKSTAAVYDYLSIDMETKTITTEGHYELAYNVITGVIEKKGKPLWGIPE